MIMMIRSEAANIFPRRKGSNKVASVVRLLFDRYLLILLYIAFSVSIIQLFHSRFTLLVTTLSLLLILVLIRFRKIDKIIYYVVLYMIVIQLLAMIRFNELNTGRLLSLGLSVTRFMLSYLLIKLSGKYFFKWFEKISFVFIVAGLFIFFRRLPTH